ncbi:MAG: phosphoribosylanthranilate isomerase [Ferruginibacter sp.]
MRVKVCGITHEEQLKELPAAGASFAGFIFYPKSPRYVLRHMTTNQIKKENSINKVGVFVNASVDEVLHMVDECRLHMVQLHGDETPKYCEKIADYISVVKAFRFSETDNIGYRIQEYMSYCDMFMFDTEGVGYGGTGKKLNLEKLHGVQVGKPYFLSGMIDENDAAALNAFAQRPEAKALFAIDLCSRFEVTTGIKDMEKIKGFIQQLV